ncbi:hypothetical protein MP228_005159 [Amoeboaphelidium protococcarum]|nr:hypothetical protein MP228_005159 [Amoeboaphelidium protococcarum]
MSSGGRDSNQLSGSSAGQPSVDEQFDRMVEDLARTPIDDLSGGSNDIDASPSLSAVAPSTSSSSVQQSNSRRNRQQALNSNNDQHFHYPSAATNSTGMSSQLAMDSDMATTATATTNDISDFSMTDNTSSDPAAEHRVYVEVSPYQMMTAVSQASGQQSSSIVNPSNGGGGDNMDTNGQTSSSSDQAENQAQVQLRRQIMEVQKDLALDNSEKARRIQKLMMQQFSHQPPVYRLSQLNHQAITSGNQIDKDTAAVVCDLHGVEHNVAPTALDNTYFDESVRLLGCKHYQRSCKLQAACCGKFYTCRLCHDEQETDHQINRHATVNMMCMLCKVVQPAAQQCANPPCQATMARYYCDVCKFWNNDPNQSIYHCDKCGLCRIGRGLGIDYFHCDKCNVCLAMNLKDNHRCIERNLDQNCPICEDYMFTSTSTVIFMACGHSIHLTCYNEHIKNSYQCPICWKSLSNMNAYFQQIDKMLENHTMPAEYEDFYSVILCNDCEEKSKTKYHFLYHKCQCCGSYNTKVLQTQQERQVNPLSGNLEVPMAAGNLASPDVENSSGSRPRSVSSSSADQRNNRT